VWHIFQVGRYSTSRRSKNVCTIGVSKKRKTNCERHSQSIHLHWSIEPTHIYNFWDIHIFLTGSIECHFVSSNNYGSQIRAQISSLHNKLRGRVHGCWSDNGSGALEILHKPEILISLHWFSHIYKILTAKDVKFNGATANMIHSQSTCKIKDGYIRTGSTCINI